jgi:hypothetical protein
MVTFQTALEALQEAHRGHVAALEATIVAQGQLIAAAELRTTELQAALERARRPCGGGGGGASGPAAATASRAARSLPATRLFAAGWTGARPVGGPQTHIAECSPTVSQPCLGVLSAFPSIN